MAYLAVGLNFPYIFRFKNASEPQNGGHFKHFEIFEPIFNLHSRFCACITHHKQIFSALLAICAGNSPLTGEFPAQRPVTRSFDILFDLPLNKRLSKQSRGWWFETRSRPLWRHRNVLFYDPVSSCNTLENRMQLAECNDSSSWIERFGDCMHAPSLLSNAPNEHVWDLIE